MGENVRKGKNNKKRKTKNAFLASECRDNPNLEVSLNTEIYQRHDDNIGKRTETDMEEQPKKKKKHSDHNTNRNTLEEDKLKKKEKLADSTIKRSHEDEYGIEELPKKKKKKHRDKNTSQKSHENECDIEKQPTTKIKHTDNSSHMDECHIEEQPKKKKKHGENTSHENECEIEKQSKKKKRNTNNDTVQKTYDEHESDIEEQLEKKRQLDDSISQKTHDECDIEEQPKKKKKHAMAEETTDKKEKKSIRQMKREKFLQRQAKAELASKHQLKLECLSYISQWKHDKQNWKFMKAKQVWLFKNKFSTELVPNEQWPILLEYFGTGQGNIRKILIEDASKIIKQMDEWTEAQENKNVENEDENATEHTEITKPDDVTYKRARDLIQFLE